MRDKPLIETRQLPRWVRRVLVINRKVVMTSIPSIYVLGILFVAVFGAQAVAGEWSVYIDVTKYPFWLGYFMLYGSIVLMMMFMVEMVRQALTWSKLKGRKRREADWFDRLIDRLRSRVGGNEPENPTR